MSRVALVIIVNVLLTVITAGAAGPAAGKLEDLFGLIGWAGRLPFYLLPFYIGPAVLLSRPTFRGGTMMGVALALPLVFWSIATKCPPAVPVIYLLSGALQGGLLGSLAQVKAR